MIKMRWVAVALLGLIGFTILRGAHNLPIAKSCTTAAFALETSTPAQLDVIRMAITGPDGSYAIGIDIVDLKVAADGAVQLVPAPGARAGDFQLGGKFQTVRKCVAYDRFAVNVTPGLHVARLFRIEKAGATQVAEQKISVDPPRKR